MRNFSLTDRQMSGVAFVERAAKWSRDLTLMRARGPGDLENAMRAIEHDYGIPFYVQWRLRYRSAQLRDIAVSVYARIQAAYTAECERQQRKFASEIKIAKAIAGPDDPDVVAAEAVLSDSAEGAGLPPPFPRAHQG